MICTLVKVLHNLDTCLKTEISEVEILSWVIEPGVSTAINTSGDVV
jgi:hypothetical protein